MNLSKLMNKVVSLFVLIASIATVSSASDTGLTGNVNILYGDKYLSSDWDPVGTQEEFGIELDLAQKGWPAYFTAAFQQSDDTENDWVEIKGITQSIDFGVKKIWTAAGGFRPFLGTGLGWVKGEIEATLFGVSESVSDSQLGYWVTGGFGWTFDEKFNIGARLKWSSARVTFDVEGDSYELNAGGVTTGVFAGIHF